MGHVSLIECFLSIWINVKCMCAINNSIFIISRVVQRHAQVLITDNFQFLELLVFDFDCVKVAECISIMSFGCFELLFLKLNISIILLPESNLDKLSIAHLPSGWLSVCDLDQLNCEDKSGTTWDLGWTAHVSVTVFALDNEICLLTKLHGHDSLVPSFDDLTFADSYLQWLPVVQRPVEHSSVFKSSLVVNSDLLPFCWALSFSLVDCLLYNSAVGGDLHFVKICCHF